MSTLDTGLHLIRTASQRVSAVNDRMSGKLKSWMPTGLYARALLIMIVPMVVLQSVVAFVFMERHWNTATRRLSAAVVQDIATLIDVYQVYPQDKGREAPNFRPRGAREVRRAAQAFLEMKGRVERSIEQRTAMLAGVSHDLRTILTRFKLEFALIGDSPEVDAMRKDVDEMSAMLEAYLAFARGDSGEHAQPSDMAAALEELRSDAERHGHKATVAFHGLPVVTVKPAAIKRCLANLVTNGARHGDAIAITGHRDHRYRTVTVDRRSAHNALNNELCSELRAAWQRFHDSDDRVAVLASAEDDYYTVGADVNGLPDNMWHAVPGLGVELDKPVIAATSGWVVGGGFVLVQMADLCVASETTRFIYPEA